MSSATVTLYTAQPEALCQNIRQGATHYARMDAIAQKYGHEIAPVFIDAYRWFIRHAEQRVPRTAAAESAIWVYYDARHIEQHTGYTILALDVPLDEAVFFKMSDWNSVLNQRFLGLSPQESAAFALKLERQGVFYEGDLFRKPFYPQLKREVIESWQRMFRFHEPVRQALAARVAPPVSDVQAAIWQIPPQWVKGNIF